MKNNFNSFERNKVLILTICYVILENKEIRYLILSSNDNTYISHANNNKKNE